MDRRERHKETHEERGRESRRVKIEDEAFLQVFFIPFSFPMDLSKTLIFFSFSMFKFSHSRATM